MLELERELSSLEPGSHLCAATVSRDESHGSIAAFLHDGMRRGEYCVLVAPTEHQDAVCGLLNQAGVCTASLRERGAFILRDPHDVYAADGKVDPERTIEIVRLSISRAHELGFHAYRAASVPGSLLYDGDISPAALASYEAGITELMGATRSQALCAFNRRRLPTDLVGVMLQTHPLALLAQRLCHNPFCEPPSHSRGAVAEGKKINWMINKILHHEDSSRGLRFMNDALIREAVSLAMHSERQHQRGDDLQRALLVRDALLSLVTRWLARPLPYLSAKLKSVVPDERLNFAGADFDNCRELLASLQRLARGLQDVDAVVSQTASLCPEDTDLVPIVSEAMASLPGLQDRERAHIRLSAPGRLVGWWDGARLTKVAQALIAVACEHGCGAPVDVRLDDAGSTARLTVQFRWFGPQAPGTGPAPPAREDPDGSAVAPAQKLPNDQLVLALWPSRETIRQMGGSFDLSTWSDGRVLVTVELPRCATATAQMPLVH